MNDVSFDDYDISDYSNLRLTVDYPEDYELMKKLFQFCKEAGIDETMDGMIVMKFVLSTQFNKINEHIKPKYENTELRKKLDEATTIKT